MELFPKNSFLLRGNYQRILWLLLILASALKACVLVVVLMNFESFLEPDTLDTYIPVSNDFITNYIVEPGKLTFLDAEVTPVFPMFLALPFTLKQSLVLIFSLSFITLFLYFKLIQHLFNTKLATLAVVILSWEPSFFVSALRLAPETIYTFFVMASISVFVLKPFQIRYANYLIGGFLLGLSTLTRPIGLVIFIAPTIYLLANLKRIKQITKFLFCYFSSLALPFLWSLRNYLVHGFFGVSTIASNNLLFYEGAAAKAESTNQTLELVQDQESLRREIFLHGESGVSQINSYNLERGVELITEYPMDLIHTHVIGVFKLFFGPGREFVNQVFSVLPYRFLEAVQIGLVLTILFLVVLNCYALIGTVSLLAVRPGLLGVISVLLIPLIIVSSGSIAYSRFRSPIAPIICLMAAIGFSRFLRWLVASRRHFT